jgi:hypothetical protein
MHHWYSSSVSPFQAKTGTPVAAMAAAAWSWVEKMLHDDQVTWAPRAVRVSMRTALQKSGQIERWVSSRYLRSRGQAERQKSSRTFGWLIGAGADRDESQLDELCCALPRKHPWLQRRTHVEAAGDASTLEGLRLGELEGAMAARRIEAVSSAVPSSYVRAQSAPPKERRAQACVQGRSVAVPSHGGR